MSAPSSEGASSSKLTVLVYSDDASTREKVHLAVGTHPARDLPSVEYLDCATQWAVLDRLRKGGVDMAVLDGEAVPAGGMGVCRTVKEEIYNSPPILVLIGRRQDNWLAAWSRADAVVSFPLDPIELGSTAAALLRSTLTPLPGTDVVVRG